MEMAATICHKFSYAWSRPLIARDSSISGFSLGAPVQIEANWSGQIRDRPATAQTFRRRHYGIYFRVSGSRRIDRNRVTFLDLHQVPPESLFARPKPEREQKNAGDAEEEQLTWVIPQSRAGVRCQTAAGAFQI
jgi:hypothetical protein